MWDSLQREWKQQQYVAVVLLVLGIAGLAYGGGKMSVVWVFWSGLVTCLALFWLFRLSLRKPVSELYHLLLEEPQDVVWVYSMITERLPFGLSFSSSAIVYLIEKDGDEFSVSVPANKVKLVVRTLNRVLPTAEFGYTEEREQKYRGEVTQRKFSWPYRKE